MIIRLDQSFIETLSQLGENFSGNDRQRLTAYIDFIYDDIRSTLKEQENKNADFETKSVEIGKIDSMTYTLNFYE